MDDSVGREHQIRAAARRLASSQTLGPVYQPSICDQALGSISYGTLLKPRRVLGAIDRRFAQSAILIAAIKLGIARVERDGTIVMN